MSEILLSVSVAATDRPVSVPLSLTKSPLVSMSRVIRNYLELSKARIVFMVLITTLAGFLCAGGSAWSLALLHTLIGTAVVAAGTNAFNQYFERQRDARMQRTRNRPVPAGRISPFAALVFSASASGFGLVYLLMAVNELAALLAAITLFSYVVIYTPLKVRTTVCTLVGAVPGAIPPMIGWAAVSGDLGAGAWILFGILFLWQLPHFLAISWMYRQDYERGGFVMTAVSDPDGRSTSTQAVLYALALLPVSLLPVFVGMTGALYAVGTAVAGLAMVGWSLRFASLRSHQSARELFLVSIVYLPLVMSILVIGTRL